MQIVPSLSISWKTIFRIVLPVFVAAGLSGCASALERRIGKHPESWAALPANEKALAERRGITEGMSKDGVFFSWGPPHRLSEVGGAGIDAEIWRYYSYVSVPTYRSRVGFGYGYGGGYRSYCPGGGYGYYDFGPDYVQVPEESASVEFQKGKVRRWETSR